MVGAIKNGTQSHRVDNPRERGGPYVVGAESSCSLGFWLHAGYSQVASKGLGYSQVASKGAGYSQVASKGAGYSQVASKGAGCVGEAC